jgi:hypothetical protein
MARGYPGGERADTASAASERETRIAVWSGPRNISTALLRSWGSRPDTFVCDEPLYAHYLRATGVDHPGREEIVARCETDWRAVVRFLTGPIPEKKKIFYQKHMAHHLLPEMDRGWIRSIRNALLIRDPGEMLTSLVRVTPNPDLRDTGLPQQWELFETFEPPVVDARDVLADPRAMLEKLCSRLGVPFTEAMLSWPAGPRPTDGIWAKHWYGAVERSTGFEPWRPKPDRVPAHLSDLHAECLEYYRRLHARRIR